MFGVLLVRQGSRQLLEAQEISSVVVGGVGASLHDSSCVQVPCVGCTILVYLFLFS